MGSGLRSRRCANAVLLALLLTAAPSAAQTRQDAEGADTERALELGHEGLTRFQAGDFEAAREKFDAAERAAHSVVFVLYLARSHAALGQLLAARTAYRSAASESLPETAPPAWHNAVREAAPELSALEARIPSLELTIRGEPPFQLELGERKLELTARRTRVELDPGKYELTLRDARSHALSRPVELSEAEKLELTFEFPTNAETKAPRARRVVSLDGDVALNPVDDAAVAHPQRAAAWTALGLGASALVFGGVTGVLALERASDVKRNCVRSSCLVSDRDEAYDARQLANLSTVGFVVGAVGIATGVTLLLWEPEEAGSLRARLSPSAVEVEGAF
jgi:hypothetical protein